MPTLTENVRVFDQSFYQAMSEIVGGYFQEDPDTNWIHQKVIIPTDAPEYKKPLFGFSTGVTGETKLGDASISMETSKDHKVYNLNYVRANIKYDVNDMMIEGKYLVQRKAQELATWYDQVKQAVFKGVRTGLPNATGTRTMYDSTGKGQGTVLNVGIIEQATLVENLNGGDSLLDAAGDVYKALTKMLRTIPSKYRDGRKVKLGMDDLFAFNARNALFRGATNQDSELDLFFKEWGLKLDGDPIISDKLFLNQVAGDTKTEADTIGTHSRLFVAISDPEIVEQAYSRVGMVGERRDDLIQSVIQNWAARLSGCVHRPEAVLYSEQITWA